MQKHINKEDWVALFREVGLNDATMSKWHQLFEERYPEGHADFLNWLGLSSSEVAKIRNL
jgi:hypothetical protein